MTYQQSEYVQLQVPQGVYNFNSGQPSPQLLPLDLLRSTAGLSVEEPTFLQYSARQGCPSFRQNLASFLVAEAGDNVSADELLLTGGNSSAIQLIATHIAAQVHGNNNRGSNNRENNNHGKNNHGNNSHSNNSHGHSGYGKNRHGRPLALVGTPTYQFAVNILVGCGFAVKSIPVDRDGIAVDEIERLLIEEKERPALVYTIPSYQNPTAVNLHPDRRRKLIGLAHDFDFYILADEPYQLLHFPDNPIISPLASADTSETGVVFTVGTYSKIFAPAVRLGWVQAKPRLIAWLSNHPVLTSGGGMNPLMAGWIEPLMANGGLHTYLQYLRQEYCLRYRHMLRAIKEKLPALQIFSEPGGGYFLWCRLPDSQDSSALNTIAQDRYGVSFRTGGECNAPSDYMRFCFAYHTPSEIDQGIELLASAYKEYTGH